MKNIIVSGTSGVGKSYLEEVLKKKYDFYPLIKYMDRDPRPGEESNSSVGFMSRDEFQSELKRGKFAYHLEYAGHFYGWKKDDIENHKAQNKVLAVTLESLIDIFEYLPDFSPVLLTIDPNDLSLLENRLKKRENYDSLNPRKKQIIDQEIEKRLKIARSELKDIQKYIEIVEKNSGKVFFIKDDRTLFDEVIPFCVAE